MASCHTFWYKYIASELHKSVLNWTQVCQLHRKTQLHERITTYSNQQNNTQDSNKNCDTRSNEFWHNDTRLLCRLSSSSLLFMLSVKKVKYAERYDAYWHLYVCKNEVYCAECSYAECHYAECHYAECYYAECHYAECRYAECRGIAERG
jgi:hypothetical protein